MTGVQTYALPIYGGTRTRTPDFTAAAGRHRRLTCRPRRASQSVAPVFLSVRGGRGRCWNGGSPKENGTASYADGHGSRETAWQRTARRERREVRIRH